MILKKIFILFLLFSAVIGQSQSNAAIDKKTNTHSLLWKISGNGLKKASYLYGTIHVICDATLDAAILKALDRTAQLYLEIDLDDPGLQAAMASHMMMKDNQKLSDLTAPEDFKIFDAYTKKKTGFSASLLNTFKPFLVSAMFLPSLMDCPIQSVEESLMAVSNQQEKPVFGLETAGEQMAVFDAIPYQVQMDELMESVKNDFVKDKAELMRMHAVYSAKDIDAMLEMTKESENGITSKYQDILLHDRNAKWIPKIEQAAKEKPTFFGVGAGHLAGEKGVIALLRKKGYQVEAQF